MKLDFLHDFVKHSLTIDESAKPRLLDALENEEWVATGLYKYENVNNGEPVADFKSTSSTCWLTNIPMDLVIYGANEKQAKIGTVEPRRNDADMFLDDEEIIEDDSLAFIYGAIKKYGTEIKYRDDLLRYIRTIISMNYETQDKEPELKEPKIVEEYTNQEKLSFDNIEGNPYELFESVGANYLTDNPNLVTALSQDTISKDIDSFWRKLIGKFLDWLYLYKKMNEDDRLCISDIVVTEMNKSFLHGVVLITNGLNGSTQYSRQSLKHVMDTITYLEDFYGARAWISNVYSHSDVYYYAVSFAIWSDNIMSAEHANHLPLIHENKLTE